MERKKEIWKHVVGYEGLYEVSDCGNVKSVQKRIDKGGYGAVVFPEKILRRFKRHLYLGVNLYRDKKSKTHTVHRLVAMAFVPNIFSKEQVNHIDGNKFNNHATNLEWCTPKENTHHAIDIGIFSCAPVGEKNGQSKLTEEDVLYIKNTRRVVSRRELSVKFNISIKHIDRIRCGKRWSHVK